MPSLRAAASARLRSREAMAVISLHSPFCMAGATLSTPIFAVLRIPQRTFFGMEIIYSREQNKRGGFSVVPRVRQVALIMGVVSGCIALLAFNSYWPYHSAEVRARVFASSAFVFSALLIWYGSRKHATRK